MAEEVGKAGASMEGVLQMQRSEVEGSGGWWMGCGWLDECCNGVGPPRKDCEMPRPGM